MAKAGKAETDDQVAGAASCYNTLWELALLLDVVASLRDVVLVCLHVHEVEIGTAPNIRVFEHIGQTFWPETKKCIKTQVFLVILVRNV